MVRFFERHFLFHSVVILLLLAALAGVLMLRIARDNDISRESAVSAASNPSSVEAVATGPIQVGSWPDLANKRFFGSVEQKLKEEGETFIEADLSALRLRVYKGNDVALEVPIKTIGREGSWWQTPVGFYKVQTKEENHFSSFGHVYMPWSLNFQGNFFIHGWPYHPDGTDVSSQYSGGCIRLDTADAEALYRLVDTGTPVLVFEEEDTNNTLMYADHRDASFPANTFLAADTGNNAVLAAKDAGSEVQMGAAVHLLAALVGVEYINIEHLTTVPDDIPASARLTPGERISVYDLLHLGLAENNNDALRTIAGELGEKRFVTLMNNKAAAIGMQGTHLTSVSSNDPGNVTTAEDLFTLGSYLARNRSFILGLTRRAANTSVYGAPVFSDLVYDPVLTGLPGFQGGVRDGAMAMGVFNVKVGSTTRQVFLASLAAADPGAALADMRAWIQRTYE